MWSAPTRVDVVRCGWSKRLWSSTTTTTTITTSTTTTATAPTTTPYHGPAMFLLVWTNIVLTRALAQTLNTVIQGNF